MFTYCFIDYKTLFHWQDYPTPLNVGAPPPSTAHLSQVKTCLLSLWICVCLTLCDWNRLDNRLDNVNILAFRVEKMKIFHVVQRKLWRLFIHWRVRLKFAEESGNTLNSEKSECIPRYTDPHLLCNLAVPNSTLT